MSYEAGFAAGEQRAFLDRQSGVFRDMTDRPSSEYQRGYIDGYTPRSATWLRPLVRKEWAMGKEAA